MRQARRAQLWAALVVAAALVPFAPGLFGGNRIFYVRDLSLFFWGRYLWLRRTLWSGESPFWDPYVGAGQAAAADALHQMFLVPVVLLRMVGSEVTGFNLWVALPFPLAALGAWLFLRRRFSPMSAAIGALAFALSGPIVSTGNFPNMSWAVASLPWVLWSVERAMGGPTAGQAAVIAATVAFQALAGEPVTLFATLLVAGSYVVFLDSPPALGAGARRAALIASALALGLLLAAVQLLPLAEAAQSAERWNNVGRDVWSLHPLMLLDTVSLHIFGDYFTTQSLSEVPWLPPLNSGREPFFFSMYFGVPLLTLAAFGFASGAPRGWTRFWALVALAGLIGAFGIYTPIYPLLRDHVPVLGSFRFPVKYLVIVSMALSAAAAAGWEALTAGELIPRPPAARRAAVGFAVAAAVLALAALSACLFATTSLAFGAHDLARFVGATKPIDAAEFLIKTLPRASTSLLLIALATAGLMAIAASRHAAAHYARLALYVFIAGDLLVHAWGINPAFDAKHLAEPDWLARTKADSQARFYVGGKREGTLDPGDADSSRAFLNPPGLRGSASRAALSNIAAYYPSGWQARELLSYDLAVLWPRAFGSAVERFFDAGPAARERFLQRGGVRYRVLPEKSGHGRAPLAAVPYFYESVLFDWGAEAVQPRVSIVPAAQVESDVAGQIDALFSDGWDARAIVHVDRDVPPAGSPGVATAPYARVTAESPPRLTVTAGCGIGGGFLLVLDSYSSDWQARVDGRSAELLRANGLFRAVRLAPGEHTIEFTYRPAAVMRGMAVSATAAVIVAACFVLGFRRRRVVPREPGLGPE